MPDRAANLTQAKEAEHKHTERAQRRTESPTSASPVAIDLTAQQIQVDPKPLSPADVIALQRAAGNQAVTRAIQAKLVVGPANDFYEQEADRVAQEVLNMPSPAAPPTYPAQVDSAGGSTTAKHSVQRESGGEEDEIQMKAAVVTPSVSISRLQRAPEEEEEVQTSRLQRQEDEEELQTSRIQRQEDEEEVQTTRVQRQEDEEEVQTSRLQRQEEEEEVQTARYQPSQEGSFSTPSDFEDRLNAARTGGAPLPGGLRADLEPRFGTDFSSVRVHTGSDSNTLNRQIQARAFTRGSDIFFGEGQYNPETQAGKTLIAHELTHTIQQDGARDPSAGVRRTSVRTAQRTAYPYQLRRSASTTAMAIAAGQSGVIQRWGIKAIGGVFGHLKGHEALTEVAMEDWKNRLEKEIKDLKAAKKSQKGDERKETDRKIEEKEAELKSQEDVVAGSRWNDMLHNSTIAGLKYEIGKEGTLTNASHEGNLQFLHSMASSVADQAWQTQHKIMMWAEFCYAVATGNLPTKTPLEEVVTTIEKDFTGGPSFAELFKLWGKNTVGWLFTGSTDSSNWDKAKGMALGSMLHMLQDSFCMSHAQRVVAKTQGEKTRRIKGFNVYTEQSGGVTGRHAKADEVQGNRFESSATRVNKTAGGREAVQISADIIGFFQERKVWSEVKTYLEGKLGLVEELQAQKPEKGGKWEEAQTGDQPDSGKRIVSASGRLFRQTQILEIFKDKFGRTRFFEPDAVSELRGWLVMFNDELDKELKSVTELTDPWARYESFIKPQSKAVSGAIKAIDPAYNSVDGWKKKEEERKGCKEALDKVRVMLNEDAKELLLDLQSLRDLRKEEQAQRAAQETRAAQLVPGIT